MILQAPRTRLILALAVVTSVCTRAQAATGNLVDKVKRDWCAQLDDDPGFLIHAQRMGEIKAAGEPARKALLSVAGSKDGPWLCALSHLVELQELRAIPVLRKILSDSTRPADHLSALRLLGAMNDGEAVTPALDFLRSGWERIGAALNTLGGIHDERARDALRKAAGDPRYMWFLTDIVRGLGAQRDPKAVEVLTSIRPEMTGQLWGEGAEASLRGDIAVALIKIGTPEALLNVRDVLAPTRDQEIGRYTLREVLRVLDQEKAGKAPAEVERFDEVIRQAKALQAKENP